MYLYSQVQSPLYKVKLLDESIVEESPEEGSTFFVNQGNCTITFIQINFVRPPEP
jgi:hypothetical protein